MRKSYRRGSTTTEVLGGVDLTVGRGECVFLVGPSGSGKSTLLSILGCILTPDDGQLRILGREIGQLNDRLRIQIRRDVIGFVFQRFQLIRGLTVLDNVLVPLRLQGKPLHVARPRVAGAAPSRRAGGPGRCQAESTQCGPVPASRVGPALANDPLIILADEPTASLDAATGDEIMQLLRRLISSQFCIGERIPHWYDTRLSPWDPAGELGCKRFRTQMFLKNRHQL